jgi:hypothetical protein
VKFWFWFLWSIDAVIAAVALYFFFSLAASGRVGSFNLLSWLAILAVLGTVVARQHLVALGRPASCCHRSSPAAGGPGSSVRAVLASHLDYPIPTFSDPLRRNKPGRSLAAWRNLVRQLQAAAAADSKNSRTFSDPPSPPTRRAKKV